MDFLIIGLATDGPSYVPYKPRDERELNSLFGGNFIERQTISQSATAITLLFEPWAVPINEVDSKRSYLYHPTLNPLNRAQLFFGNIGPSGNHTTDLTYTPYLGKQDLILAAKRYYQLTGSMPWVVRIGGTTASYSGQGWVFEAKYPGTKFNSVTILSSGTSIVVSGLVPNFPLKSYTYSSSANLIRDINLDFDFGISPIICTQAGTAMLTSGTYTLVGGTNGSFSDADISSFLNNYTMPIGASHVLLLSTATSGMISHLTTHLTDKTNQPRMFFTNAPAYSGTVTTWTSAMVTTLPYRSNMLSIFLGDIETSFQGENISRYAAEAAAIAFSAKEGYNLTNLPVVANSFSPILTSGGLISMKNSGFIPLMRYIENDISVYEGTTSYAEKSFLFSSKVAEISSAAYDYCFQFLGLTIPDGKRTEMESDLMSLLGSIEYIEMRSVEVIKQGAEMFVAIEATLPEEILSISFTIANNRV